ncbi:MAG TPA: Spy/CpxP family protein refolding chaperone [Caulobacter sp.]|nr:Spy/CpxP family protein refolding chaperone [Caulobacter sp.]
MKLILRHAGLLASAAFALTAAGAAVAGEPAAKEKGEVKVERKVFVHRAGGPGGHHGPMAMRHHDPEAHAQHLRDTLQLRPDQEPALKAYLEATKPQVHKFEKKLEDGKPAEKPKMLTTPERLDLQAKRMADHQAAFQKRANATRAFYAALSPSQQKAFDVLHARHGGGHRVKVMRRGGPGGHGEMRGPGGPGEDRIVMLGGPGELAMIDDGEPMEFEIELEE